MEKLLVAYKWLKSFLHSEWGIEDYPIRYREQGKEDPDIPRWSAQIINWWVMTGLGDTKEAAFKNLAERLMVIKETRSELPRPGTGLPIEFAESDELQKHWGVASRIIEEVLGYDSQGVFVSDESSLWDFVETEDINGYLAEIHRIFKVDVSHIESGNLVEISKYIENNG